MKFVKFTENNDWEGESWNFWLQYDGNADELQKLYLEIEMFDKEAWDQPYELDLEPITESEVDTLVKHGGQGYMDYQNKVIGKFTCPEFSEEMVKDGFVTEKGREWFNDELYKGKIKEHFTNE